MRLLHTTATAHHTLYILYRVCEKIILIVEPAFEIVVLFHVPIQFIFLLPEAGIGTLYLYRLPGYHRA